MVFTNSECDTQLSTSKILYPRIFLSKLFIMVFLQTYCPWYTIAKRLFNFINLMKPRSVKVPVMLQFIVYYNLDRSEKRSDFFMNTKLTTV